MQRGGPPPHLRMEKAGSQLFLREEIESRLSATACSDPTFSAVWTKLARGRPSGRHSAHKFVFKDPLGRLEPSGRERV
jgi:hypothetical protein